MTTTTTAPKTDANDPSRLNGVIQELGGGDRILVQRRAKGGGYEVLGVLEAGDVVGGPVELYELIEDQFGGGRFELRVQERDENDNFGFKKGGSAVVTIAGAPKPKPTEIEPPASRAPEDRLDRLERLVERALDRPAAPPFDLAAIMPMVVQMGTQMAQTQMPLIQALTERQNADARTMLEIFRDGMDLGARDSGANPYGKIGELLTMAVAQKGGAPVGPVVQPQEIPEPVQDMPEDYPEHVTALAPGLPKLMQAARARVAPATVATQLAAAFPPEQIRALVEDPVLVDDLVAVYPPLGRYRTWCGDLIAELADMVADADELGAQDDAPEAPEAPAASEAVA